MKTKFLFVVSLFAFLWVIYAGFGPNDDDPKWSRSASTIINLNPDGQYVELPAGDNSSFSNEVRHISTPQGVFNVGPNFRVHPTASRTQSEVPITRHPVNPNFMFASANTFNVGGSTTFSCGHYVTTDGGVTFFGDDTTNFNFGDPAPMIMHTGRLLISYITSTGSMGAAYSANNGATWSGTVTFPGATTVADKNLSCVDDEPSSLYYGRCYTVYTEFSGAYVNRIVSSWSSDGGVTWSTIIPVSPVPSAGHHHQGCDVAVDIHGWVRVVYANCTTNGQNSTEDYLGWAESGTGGTSWGDMSDTKVNTNGIRSSDLLPSPPAGVIRVNGFPRIDDDETCLPTADDEYVVMAEKNFAPALDNADIVLMKTPDGGSSFTRVRVNQNGSGSYEWCPAVNVDASGGINVCYYSTRNCPTNDSAQIYLSRSTDGGATFVDVLVSDHKFKPLPITGTATGYQGDYIGITSGGAGKIIPYWCEQNPSTGGRYQAYAALVDITIPRPCEDFSCTKNAGSSTLMLFTDNFYEEYSGTNYWSRLNPSAYAIGAGSARFNSWSASSGTQQSMVSYQFTPAVANTYLTFDIAYAPWSGGPLSIDSLNIQTSNNGGTTWSILARQWGGAAGNMNTVPPGGQLTPTGGQWRPRIFLLPVGTNKIKLRGYSGFGGDIWIDNVCVQTLPAVVRSTVGLASQGMFIPTDPYWRMLDTIKVFLHRVDFPNVAVDSFKTRMAGNGVSNDLFFNRALDGIYYRVIQHRNSIETWSNIGVAYTRGISSHHNFIQPDGQAFGNNQAVVSTVPLYRGMFSGDCNQDSAIDGTDLSLIDNDAFNFVTGYRVTDLTGDNVTDGSDYAIADNNAFNFVIRIAPAGGEPDVIQPPTEEPKFENDAQRQKYEITLRLQREQEAMNPPAEKEKLSYKEFLEKAGNPNWTAPPTKPKSEDRIEKNVDDRTTGKRAGDL